MFWKKWHPMAPLFLLLLVVAIFWPKYPHQKFSVGASAHVGNLTGSFNVEAFENYDNYNDKKVMVLFYSPNCGHCKTMMGAWDSFAKANTGGKIDVVKIDCVANREFAKKHNISGYPTIRYYGGGFKGGHSDYNGGRTENAFSTFLNTLT
jgi:thiol-disulfide isomerase/thioredoxin